MSKTIKRTGVALAALMIAGIAGGAEAADKTGIPYLDEKYESVKAEESNPLSEVISGYWFRTKETREAQDDDFQNPSFIWMETGEELWETAEGEAGKSCADCHGDVDKMKGVANSYPKMNPATGKPYNLEQRINLCRTDNMKAKAWKWESDELLGMTILVRHQSKGMPVNVKTDGELAKFTKAGEAYYYQKRGQLDMSCAGCHEDNYGNYIRADLLSQGQSNGFPTYRLKWQKVGSLHRRFRGCNSQVRASRFDYGADEYVNLELYMASRGKGLPIETPALRQ